MPALPLESRWVAVLLPVCAAAMAIQVVPLPAWLVGVLSPRRLELAGQIRQALGISGAPGWLTLSLEPAATAKALVLAAQALIAFVLGLYLATGKRRARRVVLGLLGLALAEAIYGLAEHISGHNQVLGYAARFPVASGTFYNQNHFAALLALFTPVALGWLLFKAAEPVRRQGYQDSRPLELGEFLATRQGLWVLAPAVLALGVIQSASRGGFFALLAAVALFFALGARNGRGRALAWAGLLAGAVLLAFGLAGDYEAVMRRLDLLADGSQTAAGRVVVWRDSLRMLRDYPLCGVGLGNFGDAFRHYSTLNTIRFFRQAHNEWLEALLTLGVAGGTALAALAAGMFRAMARNLRRAGRDGLWMLGALSGLAGLCLFSLTDFHFHIPSLAMTAMLLAGMVMGFRPGERRRRRRGERGKRGREDEDMGGWRD